jgi:hypothetical protein
MPANNLCLQIDNLTRDTSLVTAGRAADGFWSRLRGLMGAAEGTEVGDVVAGNWL